MEKRSSNDSMMGRSTRTSRAGKAPTPSKKSTPRIRRFSSPPLTARSASSGLFSPTALVNLPTKKLSFEDFGGSFSSTGLLSDSADGVGAFGSTGASGRARAPQPPVQEEPIQVHLRVRPFTPSEPADQPPVLVMTSTDTVTVVPPEGTRSGERTGTYKFSRVHGPESTQTGFYEAVLKPVVDNAVSSGRNGLLFAYGMTNAGKTFTVLGTEEQPGLLSRAVADCVAAVNAANQAPRGIVQECPTDVLQAVPDLDSAESDITPEMLAKAAAFQSLPPTASSIGGPDAADVITTPADVLPAFQVQVPVPAPSQLPATAPPAPALTLHHGEFLSLSLSCLEVYNEQVYDVLAPTTELGGCRPILKIKDGLSGRVFVQGLKHIDVHTYDDCQRVIQEACRNRRVAETSLNGDSSRSHCVFGVHIWRNVVVDAVAAGAVELEGSLSSAALRRATGPVPAPTPSRFLWCKLSVVDLAGSERQRRTANRGVRLKEAGCINNSLMSLMHCLETIRWNQKHAGTGSGAGAGAGAGVAMGTASCHGGVARLVPFRETKLTRLFQDNLAGAGAGFTVMVLNVGPSAGDFDETIHALKYGALAREIKIAPPKVDSRWAAGTFVAEGLKRRRMAHIDENAESASGDITVPASNPATGEVCSAWTAERALWDLQRSELLSQIDDLQTLNAATRADLRQAIERCSLIEMEVREEVSNEMAELMRQAEGRLRDMYNKAANDRVAKLESMYAMRSAAPAQSLRSKRAVSARPHAQGRGRGGSSAAAEVAEDSGSDCEADVGANVAECEDEINRVKQRHAQETSSLQAQVEEWQRKFTASQHRQTSVENLALATQNRAIEELTQELLAVKGEAALSAASLASLQASLAIAVPAATLDASVTTGHPAAVSYAPVPLPSLSQGPCAPVLLESSYRLTHTLPHQQQVVSAQSAAPASRRSGKTSGDKAGAGTCRRRGTGKRGSREVPLAVVDFEQEADAAVVGDAEYAAAIAAVADAEAEASSQRDTECATVNECVGPLFSTGVKPSKSASKSNRSNKRKTSGDQAAAGSVENVLVSFEDADDVISAPRKSVPFGLNQQDNAATDAGAPKAKSITFAAPTKSGMFQAAAASVGSRIRSGVMHALMKHPAGARAAVLPVDEEPRCGSERGEGEGRVTRKTRRSNTDQAVA